MKWMKMFDNLHSQFFALWHRQPCLDWLQNQVSCLWQRSLTLHCQTKTSNYFINITGAKSELLYDHLSNPDELYNAVPYQGTLSGPPSAKCYSRTGLFCKITFPGTPNSRWPFFRYLPKKLAILYPKFFSVRSLFKYNSQNFLPSCVCVCACVRACMVRVCVFVCICDCIFSVCMYDILT